MLFNIKHYDIFVSYVVEDREIVDELYKRLTDAGLRIWYAKEQLHIGADIRSVVNDGLRSVRYGILLISPEYKSHWSAGESFVLMQNKKHLLPILHKQTIEKVALQMPGIYEIYCLNTNVGIEPIITEIVKRVKKRSALCYSYIYIIEFIKRNIRAISYLAGSSLMLALVITSSWYYYSIRPEKSFINNSIKQRIETIEQICIDEFKADIIANTVASSSLNEMMELSQNVNHNKFIFYNGVDYIQSLSGLKNEGILSSAIPIDPLFGLSEYRAYKLKTGETSEFAFVNTAPHQFEIKDTRLDNEIYEVDISYKNSLRYAEASIQLNPEGVQTRIVRLWGTKPYETLVFEKRDDSWILLQIR